jgi:phage terminase large subunit-like protein
MPQLSPAEIIKAMRPDMSKWDDEIVAEYERGIKSLLDAYRPFKWRDMARNKQLPPDDPRHCEPWTSSAGVTYRCEHLARGKKASDVRFCTPHMDWHIWMIFTGRGFGKTWTGSNWIVEQAIQAPNTTWAVITASYKDLKNVCFENKKSGILGVLERENIKDYEFNRSEMKIKFPNGSMIIGFSTETEGAIRGYNLAGGWIDELCKIRGRRWWDEDLTFAARDKLEAGKHIRLLITTTPEKTPLIRELYKQWKNPTKPTDFGIHVTQATIWENSDNLSEEALERYRSKFEGTRLARQELEGELLEDVPGALFRSSDIEDNLIAREDLPELSRIVVALDPAITSGEEADESGIVVAGIGRSSGSWKGHGFLLEDGTVKGSPELVMGKVVSLFHKYHAECVVGERNAGGDYLKRAVEATDRSVPFRSVYATYGKLIRATPIAQLMEQGRIHHVGTSKDERLAFEKLEEQLTTLTPDRPRDSADDRADAYVWAFSYFKELTEGSWLDPYGLRNCEECGLTYGKNKRACQECGTANPEYQGKAVEDYVTPEDSQYSVMYGAIRCPTCKKSYIARKGGCPRCSPQGYLKKVTSMTGSNNASRLNYTGGNWFRGRKFLCAVRRKLSCLWNEVRLLHVAPLRKGMTVTIMMTYICIHGCKAFEL